MLFVRDRGIPSALLGRDPDRCEGGVCILDGGNRTRQFRYPVEEDHDDLSYPNRRPWAPVESLRSLLEVIWLPGLPIGVVTDISALERVFLSWREKVWVDSGEGCPARELEGVNLSRCAE